MTALSLTKIQAREVIESAELMISTEFLNLLNLKDEEQKDYESSTNYFIIRS